MGGRSWRSTAGFVRRVPVTFWVQLSHLDFSPGFFFFFLLDCFILRVKKKGGRRKKREREMEGEEEGKRTPGPKWTWSPAWRKFCKSSLTVRFENSLVLVQWWRGFWLMFAHTGSVINRIPFHSLYIIQFQPLKIRQEILVSVIWFHPSV